MLIIKVVCRAKRSVPARRRGRFPKEHFRIPRSRSDDDIVTDRRSFLSISSSYSAVLFLYKRLADPREHEVGQLVDCASTVCLEQGCWTARPRAPFFLGDSFDVVDVRTRLGEDMMEVIAHTEE